MGCGFSRKSDLSPMKPSQSVNGMFKVTVQEGHIYKTSSLFDMDPYIILKMSNQVFRGYVHKKQGRQPLFNETFQFIINSCYREKGRSLQFELWDEGRFSNKLVGVATVDIDPILSTNDENKFGSRIQLQKGIGQLREQSKEESMLRFRGALAKNQCRLKVFLVDGVRQAGYLQALFEFFQEPIQTIAFKFTSANLRRKSSVFTSMNCWVQVIAGQQILATNKQKDVQNQDPPSWSDEILMFNIPRSLKNCTIRILDDQNLIGQTKLLFANFIDLKKQHEFIEQIEHNNAVSGIIKFSVSVGMNNVINKMKNSINKQLKETKSEHKSQKQKQKMIKLQEISPQQKITTLQRDQKPQQKMSDSHTKTRQNTTPNLQDEHENIQTIKSSRVATQQNHE